MIRFLKKELLVILVVFLTIITDQLTKYYILTNKVNFYSSLQVTSWLRIVYVENRGISFGILSSWNISFYLGVLSFIICAYIIFLLRKNNCFKEKISLSLILGGAIGNGLDRVYRSYVIDFIDIYYKEFHWPAFNLADSYITIGGLIYFFTILFKKS